MRSYTQAAIAETVQGFLAEAIDVSHGPIEIVEASDVPAKISDVTEEEISTTGHMSDFTILTSDGRMFKIRVTEIFR